MKGFNIYRENTKSSSPWKVLPQWQERQNRPCIYSISVPDEVSVRLVPQIRRLISACPSTISTDGVEIQTVPGTKGNVPAESIDDQEVSNHSCDANGQNDHPYSVVSMVRHIHCWESVACLLYLGHLQVKREYCMWTWFTIVNTHQLV